MLRKTPSRAHISCKLFGFASRNCVCATPSELGGGQSPPHPPLCEAFLSVTFKKVTKTTCSTFCKKVAKNRGQELKLLSSSPVAGCSLRSQLLKSSASYLSLTFAHSFVCSLCTSLRSEGSYLTFFATLLNTARAFGLTVSRNFVPRHGQLRASAKLEAIGAGPKQNQTRFDKLAHYSN